MPVSRPGRRGRARYLIELVVRYAVNGSVRCGMTANISSSGLFIAAHEALPVDMQIKVMIDWPAALDGRCPLCLVVLGRVRRIDRHGMGVAIEKYEFRLRHAPRR